MGIDLDFRLLISFSTIVFVSGAYFSLIKQNAKTVSLLEERIKKLEENCNNALREDKARTIFLSKEIFESETNNIYRELKKLNGNIEKLSVKMDDFLKSKFLKN